MTITVTVEWGTSFDRARRVTCETIFWYIKESSVDDHCYV